LDKDVQLKDKRIKFSINGYEFVAKINRFPSGELGGVLPNDLRKSNPRAYKVPTE
jgi:hypothetical protein